MEQHSDFILHFKSILSKDSLLENTFGTPEARNRTQDSSFSRVFLVVGYKTVSFHLCFLFLHESCLLLDAVAHFQQEGQRMRLLSNQVNFLLGKERNCLESLLVEEKVTQFLGKSL